MCALPLEGALHLLLLLVGLLDLVGDPGQELLKIGQEVRLVSPELGPETAHLVCPGEREGGGGGVSNVKPHVRYGLWPSNNRFSCAENTRNT